MQPLTVSLAAVLIECSNGIENNDLEHARNQLASMFPVRSHCGEDCFMPFHKSVVDWLTSELEISSHNSVTTISYDYSFYIDIDNAHALYADQLWMHIHPAWLSNSLKCDDPAPVVSEYLFRYGLRHLALGGRIDDAVSLYFHLRFLVMAVTVAGAAETYSTLNWMLDRLNKVEQRNEFRLLGQLFTLATPGLGNRDDVSVTRLWDAWVAMC
jgi:hypothetical protein